MDLTSWSDEKLVTYSLQRGDGDTRAFQELFRRYQKMVWWVCYNMVGNAEDAEDLLQEVFFKTYRSLGQFQKRSSFKTWLYRIAVNTGQNELRRRARRPQLSTTSVDELTEVLPDNENPEKEVSRREQQRVLTQLIAELSPHERDALLMKDVEHRSYLEIADVLDIGLSTAKMRVQRARLKLQARYKLLNASDEVAHD